MANDSGICSDNDMTPIRPGNDDEIESECLMVESAECSTSLTTVSPLQKSLKIEVKLFGRSRSWETNGRETIVDMVKRMLNEIDHRQKPKIQFMFFKRRSDEAYLNIGAPTGVLQEEEKYECIFKNEMKQNTKDTMRSYNAEKFDKNWGMKSFCVKFADIKFSVSYLQRFKGVEKLLVHFFPGESLYEALYRDGRFGICTKDELVIRKCDFLNKSDVEICLSAQASNHAEEEMWFKRRVTTNAKLPSEVHPFPEPFLQVDGKPSMSVKKEYTTPVKATYMSNGTTFHMSPAEASSTPNPNLMPDSLTAIDKLIKYLKEKLKLEFQPEDINITSNNEKIFKKHYENFALDYQHQVFLSDLENILRLKHSIGVIIAVNESDCKVCAGTCFRIGTKYIMTNKHVIDDISKYGILLHNCYVDFNYKEPGQPGYYVYFASYPVLVTSEELDYAILELGPKDKALPPSVIDPEFGFNIPTGRQLGGGESLSFIGHPGDAPKQMDVSCPIKNADEIREHLALAFRKLDKQEYEAHKSEVLKTINNPDSAAYDVSTFFWGSSGSPGFLIQEKLLVVLHSKGVPFPGKRRFFAVEQGALMPNIVKDVNQKLQNGKIYGASLADIFGQTTARNFGLEGMDIDSD